MDSVYSQSEESEKVKGNETNNSYCKILQIPISSTSSQMKVHYWPSFSSMGSSKPLFKANNLSSDSEPEYPLINSRKDSLRLRKNKVNYNEQDYLEKIGRSNVSLTRTNLQKNENKSINKSTPKYPAEGTWDIFLDKHLHLNCVAPVSLFKNAPLANCWKTFAPCGLVIELPNPFIKLRDHDPYWIGKTKEFAGYRALVEFERFGEPPKQYSWISFCSAIPRPLGFATNARKFITPALDVVKSHPNYIIEAREKMMKEADLGKLMTLQQNHVQIVRSILEAGQKFKLRDKVEVIDINALHRNQIAIVIGIIGDRIHVAYELPKRDAKHDSGHVLNCKSEFLYPLGWSLGVGHELYAKQIKSVHPYKGECSVIGVLVFPDLPLEIIDCIKKGMGLEIRHPVQPYNISLAFVDKVLRFGYFMVKIRHKDERNSLRICLHIESPYVLPCGFAKKHGIILSNQTQVKRIHETEFKTLDLSSLSPRQPNLFKAGMKLEAVDLCRPYLIRPATIYKVADHLMKLYFDGTVRDMDASYQWVSSDSPDIYPLGWSEMVGHKFIGIPDPFPITVAGIEESFTNPVSHKDVSILGSTPELESDWKPEESLKFIGELAVSEILDYQLDFDSSNKNIIESLIE